VECRGQIAENDQDPFLASLRSDSRLERRSPDDGLKRMMGMKIAAEPASKPQDGEMLAQLRILADQAFSRTAGAPLIPGNRVRVLRNAAENYPAWLEAIRSAERRIHFESYIIHSDETGRQFADALAAKAGEGVRVRLIYDWFGATGATFKRFWKLLRRAGVEVRCFNPPRIDNPFGWLSRDHRKMLSVDSRIAFVTGMCVGDRWVGGPGSGHEPWRDTGVAVEGPAIIDIDRAFASMWAMLGSPVPEEEIPSFIGAAGDVAMRVVASVPNIAGIYRLDQMIAAIARRSIWLADAYFVGTTPYVEALKAAAEDGVDVKLLVPRASDIPVMRALSRAGFRGLLESGIRIFEWDGPMMHAKTAVADSRWARVGSTNLNLSSWIGNYELDVVAEDERFSMEMERMFLEDLSHSTEIVLRERLRVRPTAGRTGNGPPRKSAAGSAGRTAAGVLRIGNTVGAAITNRRLLGPAEAKIMFGAALVLAFLTVVAVFWPEVIAIPIAVIGGWAAISLLVKAYRLRRGRNRPARTGRRRPLSKKEKG
jgi:cardiolipin synthase